MRILQIGFLMLFSGLGLAAIVTSERLHAAEKATAPACQVACIKKIGQTAPGEGLTDI